MMNDYIFNIRLCSCRPKRLRLRDSVSPYYSKEHEHPLVMSRARLGIRQSIGVALWDEQYAVRKVCGMDWAARTTATSILLDFTDVTFDLQRVMMRARERWCGADEAHA